MSKVTHETIEQMFMGPGGHPRHSHADEVLQRACVAHLLVEIRDILAPPDLTELVPDSVLLAHTDPLQQGGDGS